MQDSHSQVDINMLAEAADVNGIYEEALESLRAAKFADIAPAQGGAKIKRRPKGKTKPKMSEREKEQAAMDYYANVRTNVLLTWVLSNVSGMISGDTVTKACCRVCFFYSFSQVRMLRVHLART